MEKDKCRNCPTIRYRKRIADSLQNEANYALRIGLTSLDRAEANKSSFYLESKARVVARKSADRVAWCDAAAEKVAHQIDDLASNCDGPAVTKTLFGLGRRKYQCLSSEQPSLFEIFNREN